jgi:hypothetical protein
MSFQDDRIDRLVLELDSDKWSVIEKATAELIRIGKPALPALRKARKESSSPDVRQCAQQAIDGYMDVQVKKIIRERHPDEQFDWLGAYPLNCRDDVERFFPGHLFYLATLNDERPASAWILTPDNEILDYPLCQSHKDEETVLLRQINKAGVTVRNKDEARSFALLWLLLAYGTDEFRVETTDHQSEVRY